MKKFTMIFMVVIIFFMPIFNTYNQQTAHANVISKPLQIAAKKSLKELGTNAAIEMAEHIAFEMLINEFVNSPPPTEQGFEPVCLDGRSKSYEDCAPDKRAQVKTNLTTTDKQALANRVETVIERKTNTDSRFNKFLDIFIPIFLVSGIVSWVSAKLDSDSKGLIDDIANDALKETGLLKTLMAPYEIVDYEPYFTSAETIYGECFFDKECPTLKLVPKQNLTLSYGAYRGSPKAYVGDLPFHMVAGTTYELQADLNTGYWTSPYLQGMMRVSTLKVNRNGAYATSLEISDFAQTFPASTTADASDMARKAAIKFRQDIVDNSSKSNAINLFFKMMMPWNEALSFGLTPTTVTTPVNTEDLQPNVSSKYNNLDGTFTVPGQSSIPIKTQQGERVYPGPTGDTWTTLEGELVDVDPDTLIVEDVTTEDDTTGEEEGEEEFPSCSKSFKKIQFKKVGTAFTNAFPFSIPWDIKRFIDASFGGVGDTRPSFDLPDYLGGVKLEIPAFFDNWIGFMRTFVVIVFDISLIYLFYRIMRGGGGD